MLHIIYGRGGCGKTAALLRSLPRNDGQAALFLVPETASHMTERRLSETLGDASSRFCEVLTFRRLAQRIFTVAGGLARQSPDDGARILFMYDAFQRVRRSAKVYTNLTRSCRLLGELLALYDECAAGCADAKRLAETSVQCPGLLHDKLADLSLLYGSYEQGVRETLADPRDLLERVRDLAVQSGFFTGKTVFLDGFEGFTPREWALLEVVFSQCRDVWAAFSGDSVACDEDSVFFKPMHTCSILARIAENHSHSVEYIRLSPREDRPRDASYLEAYFEDYAASSYTGVPQIVQLHTAPTPQDEYTAAAAEILRLTRENGLRYRDCAVVTPSEDGMQTLTELLGRCGVPYFLSEKTDLLSTSVCAMAVYALEAVAEGLKTEDVLAYLKTGMTSLAPADLDLLENYLLVRKIRSFATDTPWTGHPDGFLEEFTPDDAARLEHLNELRVQVRTPLAALRERTTGVTPAIEKARALYDFLETVGLPECCLTRAEERENAGDRTGADLYRQLWDILCRALDSFASVLGNKPLDLPTFASLFRLTLTQYSAGVIPSALDRVHVGSLETLQTHSAKAVFVVGLTDDAYPGNTAGAGLLTDAERDRLDAMGLELSVTADGRERARRFAFYTTFYTPDTLLWYSCPQADAAGKQLRPSSAFARLSALLPETPVTEVTAASAALSSPVSALEYALSRENAEAKAALHWFEEQKDYARQVRQFSHETLRGPLYSPALRDALYGARPRLSASGLDRFFDCRYHFFLQNGLKLDERRPAEFDSPAIGSFLHYVLQHTVEDIHNHYENWKAAGKARVLAIGRQYAEQYIEERLKGALQGNARFARQLARVRLALNTLLGSLYDEFSVCLFEPKDFELSFSTHDVLGSVEIPLGEGRFAVLSGKVDRVDGFLHDGMLYIRVVDYKSAVHAFSFTDVKNGLSMQLPLYLFVLQNRAERYARLHPELPPSTPLVPAGIMYVPVGSPFAAVDKPPEDDAEVKAVHAKKDKRTGLFLADNTILNAMNPRAGDDFIPVSFKSDGSYKANAPVAEPQEFRKLEKHVRQMLAVMGKELTAGKNEANPRLIAGGRTSCTNCPYAAVCRFDPLVEFYRRLEKVSQEEFFAAIPDSEEGGNPNV